MRILSISIPYPRPDRPFAGLFVQRRLAAMARRSDLGVVSPRPWFPALRPGPVDDGRGAAETPPVSRPRMLYVPGLLKGRDGFWLRRALLPELRRWHRERPLDLIDAHFEYPEAVGAVAAAEALGVPAFVTLRGLLPKTLASPSRRGPCLEALRRASGLVSVSHDLKRKAVASGIDAAKIRVVPNAIDAATFHPGPRASARASLGLEPRGALIVSVGGLEPRKGQLELVAALSRLRHVAGPLRMALVGDERFCPAYTRRVRRRIEQCGLGAEVVLTGPQPPASVASWLRAADLFALPTYHEGCCNAVLEALACGTPVVTTPVGDNAEYVDDSNGSLVPPGDVEALAEALRGALGRAWDRPAIAAPIAGRTWDHVAAEVLDFFRERLEARRPAVSRR